jgi:hypothetical protein
MIAAGVLLMFMLIGSRVVVVGVAVLWVQL